MSNNSSDDVIEIGSASLVTEPETEYDVSIRGNYTKSPVTKTITYYEDEDGVDKDIVKDILKETHDIERIHSVSIDEVDGSDVTVTVVEKGWFAVGDEHQISVYDTGKKFDEEYFHSLLHEHNIDPESVIDIEGCFITTKTNIKEKK